MPQSAISGKPLIFRRYLPLLLVVLFIAFLTLLFSHAATRRYTSFHVLNTYRDTFPACILRKQPMLQIVGDAALDVVWDFGCEMEGDSGGRVHWVRDSMNAVKISEPVLPKKISNSRFVYRGRMDGLTGGNWTYWVSIGRHWMSQKIFFCFPYQHSNEPKTMGRETEPFRIAVMGDNQYGTTIFSKLLQNLHPQPHLIFHIGDAVQYAESAEQWQTDFHDPLHKAGLLSSVPFVLVRGNHDYNATVPSTWGSRLLYYSFFIDDIHVIILDSTTDSPAQDEWLKETLLKPAKAKIVLSHIPPFTEYWEPEAWIGKNESRWGEFVRVRYVPLFESHNVTLVISGHQHNYQRGKKNGVNYLIVGGGGGALDWERVEDWGVYNRTEFMWHFGWLEVGVKKVMWTMVDVEGVLRDELLVWNDMDGG